MLFNTVIFLRGLFSGYISGVILWIYISDLWKHFCSGKSSSQMAGRPCKACYCVLRVDVLYSLPPCLPSVCADNKVTCTMPTSKAVPDAQHSVNVLTHKMTSSQSYSPITNLPFMTLTMLITVIISDPLITSSRLNQRHLVSFQDHGQSVEI